jgi:YHS domain-containing protein
MAEYDGQTYRMATQAACEKFLRSPQTYFEADLP